MAGREEVGMAFLLLEEVFFFPFIGCGFVPPADLPGSEKNHGSQQCSTRPVSPDACVSECSLD